MRRSFVSESCMSALILNYLSPTVAVLNVVDRPL